MTLYLKYRSQTFNELDLQSVRETLIDIVKSQNIPHAFLFAGPKGTGKTSAARILAKYLNCEKRLKSKDTKKIYEPCNDCYQCKSISKGDNIDIIELDAASHRGIDDVRSLKETIKLASTKAQKKVYIIDEAHMLTLEASNALLKTLEEPPSHVVFILATTNPEKLITTIRSRTTLVQFNKASTDEIKRSLKRVCTGEKIKYDEKSLDIISANSQGSFRDAIKTLESIITSENKIDKDTVEKYLLKSNLFSPEDFTQQLLLGNRKKLLDMIESAVGSGMSARVIFEFLIKHLRDRLLSAFSSNGNEDEIDDYVELIKIFTQFYREYQSETIEQLPLELAVVQWCEDKGNDGSPISDTKETADNANIKESENKNDDGKDMRADLNVTSDTSAEYQKTVTGKAAEISDELWTKILSMIRPQNASTEALLRAAKPMDFDGKKLTLGVYYSFHKEKLEVSPHRIIIEDTVSSVIGCPVKLLCTLSSPPQKPAIADTTEDVLKDGENGNVILTEPENESIISAAEKIFNS